MLLARAKGAREPTFIVLSVVQTSENVEAPTLRRWLQLRDGWLAAASPLILKKELPASITG